VIEEERIDPGHVVLVAAGEAETRHAAEFVDDGMKLGGAPAARATDRLRMGAGFAVQPPFSAPAAALMSLSPWWYTMQWYLDELDNRDTYRRWEHMWRDTWTARTPQDARDVSYQMRLWADYDVGMSAGFDGDTVAALASIRAETLLIGVREDLMVRREEMILARDAIPNATYFELDSAYGHAACCGHDPNATTRMHPVIAKFLANLGSE
jgi:homoserine O-acetyltransferase